MRSKQDKSEKARKQLVEVLNELLSDVEYIDPRPIRISVAEHPVDYLAEQLKARRMLAITPALARRIVAALGGSTKAK